MGFKVSSPFWPDSLAWRVVAQGQSQHGKSRWGCQEADHLTEAEGPRENGIEGMGYAGEGTR